MSDNKPDLNKVEEGFRLVLEGLGADLASPHFHRTPERAARAYFNELCRGLTHSGPSITAFPSEIDQMVVLQDIPIKSLCAHHLLPFTGKAAVAYIPGNGKILGLSKLSRISDFQARRPQVQEELTEQIADAVAKHVMSGSAGGVGVIIRANHMCMSLRGVNHPGNMVTSALRGVFLDKPEARAEFLKLVGEG